MVNIVVLFAFLPALVTCSSEGNIHLLENEVADAIRSCSVPNGGTNANRNTKISQRQRRSDEYNDEQYGDQARRIDGNMKEINQYGHDKRNSTSTSMREQMHVLNATDYDYGGYGSGNENEKFVNTVPRPAIIRNYVHTNRSRRSDTFLNKADTDQCLSQCVFANLQVVDSRGIPRESELWNRVQSSVTSQQSRTALRDQVRACFQDLQTEEEEDNGCSYSNKLEHCLMLRFSDRKLNGTQVVNEKT